MLFLRVKTGIILCSVLLLASCGGKSEKETRQVFRFNELGDVTSLDPALSGSFENNWAIHQLYNGLVEMNDSLQVKPCIARSWTVSEDGLVYRFILRSDVKFHDAPQFAGGKGRTVTAADFVYSFSRLFDKRVSNASTLVSMIAHDAEKNEKGFTAINDTTLEVRLRQPFAPFTGVLSMKYFSVVPHEVVEYWKDDFGRHPAGTGPFMLRVWKEKERLVLDRHPNYFKVDENGKRLPYLESVNVSFIKSPEAAFMQFLSGEQDMLSGIDAINKEVVLARDGSGLKKEMQKRYVVQTGPFLKTDYLGILIDGKGSNGELNPLQKKQVRQAINAAINRDRIVRFLRFNVGTPAVHGFLPDGMNAYNPAQLSGFTYDPDKARRLLAEAGFARGKGLPKIKLTTTASYLDIADDIHNQLSQVNIDCEIEILQPAMFKTAVAEGKVNFFRKSWIGDYPDPENFMALFYSKNFSPNGVNYMHFSNAEYDKLYEQCLTEQNDSVRRSLFLRMDELLVEESPVVPLFYDEVVRLVQKNVQGLTVNPTNLLSLERVNIRGL
ncbi:MAG: ABC transporter substrate-binding protein [Bacteroidia bacterium]|jgi:peptide/nickel transport system substrate-binding protein|nr:ABC transporter substrate-binding protein [Bacteroidia bacterium]